MTTPQPDDDGAVFPVSPKLVDQMREAFKEVFGRSQKGRDRMLLAGYRHSKTDLWREQQKAFELADSPKHLVYATKKTERFITSRNRRFLSNEDLREWDDAVREYLAAESLGIDLLEKPDTRLNRALELVKKFSDDSVVHLGSYVDRAPRRAGRDLAVFFRHLLLVKCYWHLKCIADRWDDLTTVELCALARALYECTLLIGGLIKDPSLADTLQAQAFAGTPPFPYREKRDGSRDFSTIVDEKSGETFPSRISFKKCADVMGSSHAELYSILYPMLSTQVHFDTHHMMSMYISTRSFLMWDDGDDVTTAMLSSIVLTYLFSIIMFMPGLQQLVKRDASFIGLRINDALDELIAALEDESLYNEQFDLVLTKLHAVQW